MSGETGSKSSAEVALILARANSSDSTPTYFTTNTQTILSDHEKRWHAALQTLQDRMSTYKQLESSTDNAAAESAAQNVASALRNVGDTHSDPRVKDAFYHQSRIFSEGNPDQRSSAIADIGKGFALILTTPFALVGAVLLSVGGIMHGVGSIMKGIGSLLTSGFWN